MDEKLMNYTFQVPQNTENSFDSPSMTEEETIILTIFSSGVCVIGTVSNVLLILAVLLTRRLRQTCTAVLLINLSFTDLVVCTLYVPLYIYDINYGSSAEFDEARFRLGFGLLIGTLNSEFSVTLERFISICFPYRYINWMTGYCIAAMIAASWFIAVTLTLLSLLTETPTYSLVYVALLQILIVNFHVAMYGVARRVTRRIYTQFSLGKRPNISVWNKSAKAVAMVVIASLLCWLPIVLLAIAVPPSSPRFRRYIKIALAFVFLSAVIDPFIFCWRLEDFRSALRACLRKSRGRSTLVHPTAI